MINLGEILFPKKLAIAAGLTVIVKLCKCSNYIKLETFLPYFFRINNKKYLRTLLAPQTELNYDLLKRASASASCISAYSSPALSTHQNFNSERGYDTSTRHARSSPNITPKYKTESHSERQRDVATFGLLTTKGNTLVRSHF